MSASNSKPVTTIRLEGLRKSFRGHLGIGRTVAVERIDLEVGAGEIFGLLGPNGAGKTTILKMMLGLLRPDVVRPGVPPRVEQGVSESAAKAAALGSSALPVPLPD